ncbi:lipid II flippase MurJ [Methanobacterium sp. 42_16]|uniref:lipid II flippase MurJ n=1 Tax=Methanobacterium sp. 42_16 TaxID=1641383 RepID=UPI000749462F|nr:lipid II flippase MurJ [Methanobacterium sp. 42_16]KUK71668.1 MAG: Putative membrane protein, putative virulence factor [Methanobacterium sp. 42_16]
MFKLRYNALAIIQVMVLLFNTIFLIRIFGASYQSDAYLMAVSIIDAIGLLQLMLVEQFMYFYHDLKLENPEKAHSFYNSSLFLSIGSGIILLVILFLGINIWVKLFAFDLSGERLSLLINVVSIMVFGVVFYSANYVNQRVLNAEMRFSIPYILEILNALFISISLVYVMFTNQFNIQLLAYARVIGIFAVFIMGLYFVKAVGIPIRLTFNSYMMKEFVSNSFTMRLGHNIHNLLFNPITTNILSSFPVGFASCFYYAQMIIYAINSIVVGPSNRVLLSKVSEVWSKKLISQIPEIMKKYLKNTVPIFILTVIISYLIIPYVLNLISSGSLSLSDIDLIKYVFVGLAVWYGIILIESAFVSVGSASKNSRIFIFTNSIFIIIFFCISFYFKDMFGLLVIPLAAIIAQIVNFIFYTRFAIKIIRDHSK